MKDKLTENDTCTRDERLEFAYSIMAEKAIAEILDAFEFEGIQVSPLKGALLRRVLYDNPAERIMTDIDILVRRRDFRYAGKILEKLGMRQDRNAEIVNHPRAYSHSHYYKNGFPLVELHQAAAPMAREKDFENLVFSGRHTAYPTDLFPQKCVNLPSPEVQLLILALHFREHHLLVEKHQIEDIGRLCRRFEIDSSELAEKAEFFSCSFALWLLLQASGEPSALEISNKIATPILRSLAHPLLFDSVPGGYHLKHSNTAPRSVTLALRGLIHSVYSRDSLTESVVAHLRMLLFMLRNRIN